MADQHVLIPSCSSKTSECYHLSYEQSAVQPYCTPSETYDRISLETALSRDLRLCRRCAQKNGTNQNAITDTTCPFCTKQVLKTRFPDHLQTCSQAP